MVLAMVDEDGLLGMRVASLRGQRSQKAIADDMRLRGWKWSQATMWAIERGDRSVKLFEARDLAAVLGVGIQDLFRDPEVLRVEDEIKELVRTVSHDYATATTNLMDLFASQDMLRERITDPGLKEDDRFVQDDRFRQILQLAKDASRFTPDRALKKARKRNESGQGDADDALEAELD